MPIPLRTLLEIVPRGFAFLLIAAMFVSGGTDRFLAAQSTPDGAPDSAVGEPAGERNDSQTYSPLHDFLGIDAETGRFKKPSARGQGERAKTASDSQSQRRDLRPDDVSRRGDTGSRDPLDELPRSAEDANEALRRATQSINEGSIDDLLAVLGESTQSHPLYRLHRQLVWVAAAVMMVYPIGIVFSELASWLSSRRRSGLSDMDRKFYRTRLQRRLLLAGVLAGLIMLFALGSAHAYWWNQPVRLALFGVAVIVLGAAAVALANLIRHASRTFQLDLIREVRREQLEMRAELEEIRKQLHAS